MRLNYVGTDEGVVVPTPKGPVFLKRGGLAQDVPDEVAARLLAVNPESFQEADRENDL
jgi:hypothetical protein